MIVLFGQNVYGTKENILLAKRKHDRRHEQSFSLPYFNCSDDKTAHIDPTNNPKSKLNAQNSDIFGSFRIAFACKNNKYIKHNMKDNRLFELQ